VEERDDGAFWRRYRDMLRWMVAFVDAAGGDTIPEAVMLGGFSSGSGVDGGIASGVCF
jgi:hypothetical protein